MADVQDSLSVGELAVLVEGLDDDVAFNWVLLRLGIRENPPPMEDSPPSEDDVGAAFRSIDRLAGLGLIKVGRMEYVDGGPPGRVAPLRHVEEPIEEVRERVERECRAANDWSEWAFSCWIVNTAKGRSVALRETGRNGTA
jgi:hypothetical protein